MRYQLEFKAELLLKWRVCINGFKTAVWRNYTITGKIGEIVGTLGADKR